MRFPEPKNPNPFANYLRKRGIHPHSLIGVEGLARGTIYSAYHGKPLQKKTRQAISRLTCGAVDPDDLPHAVSFMADYAKKNRLSDRG